MKKNEKLMKIDFNTKTTSGDDGDNKYIQTRIKAYKDINTYKCISIIVLDSFIYAYEKYYPQTFLEEYKYANTNVKTNNYIVKELKLESDSDSDSNICIGESDSDSDNDI